MLAQHRRTIGLISGATAFCAIAALLPYRSIAHPIYENHIEHHVRLAVSPANIDVTIELRFNELRSLSERRRMDTDRNGIIAPAERERYLRRIRRELADAFHLSCRGQILALIELYDPRIDLMGDQGVSPAHHSLRLYYFARTPADLAGPMQLDFEDRSWRNEPSLWFFTAAGSDDLKVRVDPPVSSRPADELDFNLRGRVTVGFPAGKMPATRPADAGP
jgi:hypothetical protein